MRKLLAALALIPAVSQAALVIENGAAKSPLAAVSTAKNSAAPKAATPTDSLQAGATASTSNPRIAVSPIWEIKATDATFQKLFARWSTLAGWTLVWDVPQDIPVIGQFTFSGSFTDAVLNVTDSTDGTDMPVHPCFYSNSLVRIVPISVVCNPDNN